MIYRSIKEGKPMKKLLIKVLVPLRCVPHLSVVLPTGVDVTSHIDQVIGSVTVEELASNDDHVKVSFGDSGIHQCSRSEVTFLADFTAD
jgi:hypothetical protein